MNATSVEQLPEISAAHVLAIDLFWAVRLAYVPHAYPRIGDWQALSLEHRRAFIAHASAILETYRPKAKVIGSIEPHGMAVKVAACQPTPAVLDPVGEPALCIYCSEYPAMDGSDYCSAQCVINASTEGA